MALLHVDFHSRALSRGVQMNVILPDALCDAPRPWRTLYLLHGMTDDYTIWQRRTAIERYAQDRNLAVIMPDARLSWYCDTAAGERFFSFIADELPVLCRRMFPGLSHRREDTFIAGLSMGGYGAFKCALKRPETFSRAASLSGGLDALGMTRLDPPLADQAYWADVFGPAEAIPGSENDLFAAAAELSAQRPSLFMWCGTEDFLYNMNVSMRDHLRALGYDLRYSQGPGDHQWQYWDREIENALKWMLDEGEAEECH